MAFASDCSGFEDAIKFLPLLELFADKTSFLLLGLKQIQRNRIIVVRLQQLLSLVLKLSFLAFQAVQLFFVLLQVEKF